MFNKFLKKSCRFHKVLQQNRSYIWMPRYTYFG